MPTDSPLYLPITEIVSENSLVRTFYFNHQLNSKPGQFVMLWLPDLDQKPFSVSHDDGQKFGLTICKRGPLTDKMFELKVGDKVGITGPYGTAFTVNPELHYIMVAGGYGSAPLLNLAKKVTALGATVDYCVGARTAENVLFEKQLNQMPGLTLYMTTNDGSKGVKGYVTEVLSRILEKQKEAPLEGGFGEWPVAEKKVIVATCGPELMQKNVLDICNKFGVECEVSIERYMKCGVGVCGQCAVDPLGLCLCVDGPVVSSKIANQIEEFGKYHRDKCGRKVYFNSP